MQDYVTVLEVVERPVYLVDSGLSTVSLMAATIYRLPHPRLVLTRETLMPNATDATVFFTEILGDTLEDWKRNLEEADSMIWMPLPGPTDGRKTN